MITDRLIAKSGTNGNEWLPLWMHLEDTSGVMELLLLDFVSDSFCVSCGMEKESLRRTGILLAYLHDIGKATVGFQYRIARSLPECGGALEHAGLELPDQMDQDSLHRTPHPLAGEVILRYHHCPAAAAAIVGAHHGEPVKNSCLRDQDLTQSRPDIVGYVNYFGLAADNRPRLEQAWDWILHRALRRAGMDGLDEVPELPVRAQVLLSGLLIVADWIASNTRYFPLIGLDDMGDASDYPGRVARGWEQIAFPHIWRPAMGQCTANDFKNRFGFLPKVTQAEMLDLVSQISHPGIFILEAPMGCGKTEAALAAGELLAARSKKKGVFFGLPTQATANGIFPRVLSWAEKQSADFYRSIQLKHSSALMNPVFRNIQKGIPKEQSESGVIVHSWFCESKTATLADFVIATVDQMLMSALKRRHVMLLHFGLSEKVVIIDEVHAYDAYMNQYLERALQWLGAYHTPVILLSATLPARRRMSLIHAYLGQTGGDQSLEENEAYPLLTWTDGTDIHQQALTYQDDHRTVSIRTCRNADALRAAADTVEAGGCVGIILNTVQRAQQMADTIRSTLTEQVLLYHAQYILPDRSKKEEKLLNRVGKQSSPEDRKGLVVIGTQVLEQSLDIDFDILITDLCPMDLLLQRIGRLHRHARPERPVLLREPVCWVLTEELEQERTGSRQIYGDWLLQETLACLPEQITLPDDISPLVQQVYRKSDDSEAYARFQAEQQQAQSRAKTYLLAQPRGRDIHQFLDRTVETKNEMLAEASVRDGISSVEVLLMQRDPGGVIRFPDGSLLSDLDDAACERIAQQRLRLPSRFSSNVRMLERTIRELEAQCMAFLGAWQASPWLRGKLVLFLDGNYEARLCGYRLQYSYEKGLVCMKESDEHA